MSHFVTWVLLKKEWGEDEVGTLLAPFDENMEVKPYTEQCWCKGWIAKSGAREGVVAQLGTFDEARNKYHALPKEKQTDQAWKSMVGVRTTLEILIETAHAVFNMNDPDCEDCKGKGIRATNYNPESKWDWWRIGGRWDGLIQGECRKSEDGGFNFGDGHTEFKHNSRVVQDLLKLKDGDFEKIAPFAVVTPEGEWHEKGSMGWWGMVGDEKDKDVWHKQVAKLLESFSECVAVACDLHI